MEELEVEEVPLEMESPDEDSAGGGLCPCVEDGKWAQRPFSLQPDP